MSNNLVPERRADKNGVVSTKWVRPVAGSGTAVRVPAPVVPELVVEDWLALAGSPIAGVFGESWLGTSSDFSLSQFDYAAVLAVNGLLERGVDLRQEPMRVFNQAHRRLTVDERVGDPFLPMSDLAVFGEVMLHPEASTDEMVALVNGLSGHFGAGRDYLNGVTDAERSSAVALITVITSLANEEFVEVDDPEDEGWGGDYRSTTLRSLELAELVMAYPERADEIVRIINERDSDDAGMVSTVLGSGHGALSTGML